MHPPHPPPPKTKKKKKYPENHDSYSLAEQKVCVGVVLIT